MTGTYQWDADYGGDTGDVSAIDDNDLKGQEIVTLPTPTLKGTPSQNDVTLGTSALTLNDTAVLSGGANPTGTITFTLYYNGGTTAVDTESATANGDGSYTTPTGYTLPTSAPVVGTYQWNVSYGGDSNNGSTSDNNDTAQQVQVSAANPTLTATPSQSQVTLGSSPVTLADTAVLAGGYNPTGTITFTLDLNGGAANSLWHFSAISLKTREFRRFKARKTLWQTAAPDKTRGKKVPQTGSCTP